MSLPREFQDDNYYSEQGLDNSVQKMLDKTYHQASTINQAFWTEADIDTRFKIGDQGLWDEYQNALPASRRKQFHFNRIRRVSNLITGFQRRNRKSTIAQPVEHNDDKAASQWSKLLFHAMKGANADDMISEAFENGAVTTGLSLLNVWIDYSKDPQSGDIKLDHVPYNAFLIDPYFRKKDLSDCNYVWRRQWRTKDAIKSMVPVDKVDLIDSLNANSANDSKFNFMAEAHNQGVNNLLYYDEYWYKDMREATYLIDPKSGLSREWKGTPERLKQYLAAYPQLEKLVKDVPTVKLAISVCGKTIYNGPNPLGIDRYPFVPVMGYYEPNTPYFPWRVQGIVRGLRDAQFLYSRRKNIECDILESQVNSGFKYKPTSMVNPKDIFLSGQGKGIAIKQEADMGDVVEIQPAQIPASMFQLSELMGKEIQEISGVNEELLGSADDDKSGILSMLRQGAGLTTLQILFDQLDFSQKQLGQVFQEIIQNNYMIGKISKILGEEPVEEFESKTFLGYDITIEDGINSESQRKMAFAQAISLRESGLPIPTRYILDLAVVQDKEKLMEMVEQEEQQAAQAQQQQQQMQMALMEAQMKDLDGKATANSMLGAERASRINENSELAVERRAKAIEDISNAQLNKAKTLKELQDIDLNQVHKLLQLAEMLKGFDGQANTAESAVSDDIINQVGQRKSYDMDPGNAF
jgi:hypothetical protein